MAIYLHHFKVISMGYCGVSSDNLSEPQPFFGTDSGFGGQYGGS